jgi:hypothetical protein
MDQTVLSEPSIAGNWLEKIACADEDFGFGVWQQIGRRLI